MKDILTTLKNLGVQTLSVTKGEARAVNPYENMNPHTTAKYFGYVEKRSAIFDLPPLPTSGIPDGRIGIDEVEPEYQTKPEGKDDWIICEMFDYCAMHNYNAMFGLNFEIRTALRRKTKEES